MKDRSRVVVERLRQAPIWLGLGVVVALSWLYLFHMNASMPSMTMPITAPMTTPPMTTPMGTTMTSLPTMSSSMPTSMATPMTGTAPIELLFAFVMWSVMMIAMMVPSAVPAIALFATLTGRRHPSLNPAVPTALYVSGYIAVWIGYSVFAALAQWALMRAVLISPMSGSSSTIVSALVLLGAGAYQFTPLKEACLTQCRSPLAFFMAEWRDGGMGAFLVGLRQGAYCVTCCWTLMALMFVVGMMNITWMALLTVFFLAEKVAPPAWHISRVSGAALIAWGVWVGAGPWS